MTDRARAFVAGGMEMLATLAVVMLAAIALRLNAASGGFLFLVGILFVASRRPFLVAAAGSLVAALLYNYFFFPPTRTLTIDDRANWIAVGSFFVTSILANRLLAKERRQSEHARISSREMEALYRASVALLRVRGGVEAIGEPVAQWLDEIGAASGGVILFGSSPQQQQIVCWSGAPITDEIEDLAAGVGRHRRFTEIPSRFGTDVCIPLMISGKTAGALVVRGSPRTRSALESVAALIALAVDRERFVHERAHLEALRESDELKTSLLQAVAHDLNSPLTVLTVESDALARKGAAHPEAMAHVERIREQVAQLKRRVDNLLSLARIEGGMIHPRIEPTPPADVFRSVRENLAAVVQSRTIRTVVDDDSSDVMVDPSLALEIVVNLVENAHRASPLEEEIVLRARRSMDDPARVWLEVLDRGEGFSTEQQRALRRVDLSETGNGLGLDLARTLAALNGGNVEWFPREGGGTIARLDLPAAAVTIEAQS